MIDNQTLIIPEKLGERIKALRIELGYSQIEVADDFMSVRTLQKIEKGETTPTFEILLHIANKLKIEMFDLVLSSRIPYYIEYQFPVILRSVLQIIESDSSPLAQHVLQDFTVLLEEFNEIKLPFEEQQRMETIYAILLAFTHKQREPALNILTPLIDNLLFDLETSEEVLFPDETHIFQIAAYVRLLDDPETFQDFIGKLQKFPAHYYHPTVAYNIGLIYYKKQKWALLAELAEDAIKEINDFNQYSLLPFLYCQLGVATFKLGDEKGATIFDEGLQLLKSFRQEENFDLMASQAKKDGIPIQNTIFSQII